jgi:O-antigen/teichoic acid export membrane protein
MSNKTFHSVVWTGVERFGAQLFQAIFTVVLARLLMPEDYGLIAMIFIFLMLGQMLMDGGLSLALVQKKNPSDDDFSTVFWFNIAFGLFFYSLFFLSAPTISRFFEQPLLIPIIKVAGLNFIVWSIGHVHATKLDISLDFKKQAFITMSAMITSGLIGVFLAYSGYGVWALVFQFLLNNVFRSLFFWLFGPRWAPRFIFKLSSLKSLLPLGLSWISAALLGAIYKNLYAVFIGKRYTATELGFFQQSYNFSNFATTNIAYTIARSFIPLQSKLHDSPDEQHKLFYRFLSLSCLIIFPIATILTVLAEPFVSFVLTDRWLPIVPFLQILCISYLWYPILVTNGRMLLAKGFSKQYLISEIIKNVFGFTVFLISLPHGFFWICASIGFYAVFGVIVSIVFSQKILSIQWTKQLKIIFPMFGLAVFSGFVTWCVMMVVTCYAPTWDFGKLLFGGISGIGIYVLGAHLLKFHEIKFMLDYLKKHITKSPN